MEYKPIITTKNLFSYEGSPMPPCLEEFTWVVFEEPVTIIEEYIKIIRQLGNPKEIENYIL